MTWSLRSALITTFVTLVFVVTAISTSIGLWKTSQDATESLTDRQAGEGETAATSVSNVLGQGRQALAAIGALLPSDSLKPTVDEPTVNRMLDPLIGQSDVYEVVLVLDGDGRIVHVRPPAAAVPDRAWADVPAVRQAQEALQAALDVDGASGSVAWTAPVLSTRADPAPYVLVGRLNEGVLVEKLVSPLPLEADAVLLSDDGSVVAASAPLADDGFPESWGPWEQVVRDGRSAGPVPAAASEGETLATLAEVAPYPLRVLVLGSTAELRAQQAQAITGGVLTGFLLAGLAIPVVVGIAYSVTTPLRRVGEAADRLAEGDLAVRAEASGTAEVHGLAHRFNAMADALQADRDELVRFQASLEEKVRDRTAALADKNEELEAFAYTVSHDLKAPLRGIGLYVHLIEEALAGDEDPSIQEHLGTLRKRARRLNGMIDSILAYSRAGRASEAVEEVVVRDMLRDCVESLEVPDGFDVELPPRLPRIRTRPTQLYQVFQNLLSNALHHHDGPNGSVRVAAVRTGDWIEFSVADDGPGVPAGQRGRIFDLFSGSSPEDEDSTGVGLALVRRLVEANGGAVWVEDAEPRGARFVFRWPARPEAATPG